MRLCSILASGYLSHSEYQDLPPFSFLKKPLFYAEEHSMVLGEGCPCLCPSVCLCVLIRRCMLQFLHLLTHSCFVTFAIVNKSAMGLESRCSLYLFVVCTWRGTAVPYDAITVFISEMALVLISQWSNLMLNKVQHLKCPHRASE